MVFQKPTLACIIQTAIDMDNSIWIFSPPRIYSDPGYPLERLGLVMQFIVLFKRLRCGAIIMQSPQNQ